MKLKSFMSMVAVAMLMPMCVLAREVINLDFGWKFCLEGADSSITVNLPHDYLIGQPWVEPSADEMPDSSDRAANFKSRLSARAFKEPVKGEYTMKLTPDDSWKGRRVLLDFGGIMLVGDVYLNGDRIGGTDYGYLGFEIDISKRLRYGVENEIMVKVDTGSPSNSRWYTGGGLYRSVRLIITDPSLYISRHGVSVETTDISKEKALVRMTLECESKGVDSMFVADVEILSPLGNAIIRRSDTIPVNRRWRHREYALKPFYIVGPQLWECDTPSLYTANVSMGRPGSGVTSDSVSIKFGVRDLEYSPDYGLKLNGKKVLLKGIANHHTLGALGAAAYPRAMEKRLKLLKDFGFNHVRTSHNPYSEDFLNICDSLGILVVDELYDKWLKQYAGGRKEWTAQWQEDLPEWIKRDRNHPSVIMWSLGNELQGYDNLPFNDWGVTAYRLQKTLLNRYDATRPVTVAMHPRYRSLLTDSLPAPLAIETDVASYNYRYMYFPVDAKRYPDMVFYQSEANKSAMGPNFFEPDSSRVLGLAYWGMIDYLGESAGWPAKGWTQGVFDISLQPKPEAWFVKSMFHEKPTVHIGIIDNEGESYLWNDEKMTRSTLIDHWNLCKGEKYDITVFSNAEKVELRVNGKSLGRISNDVSDPKARNRFIWKGVPFTPGKIEALAYNDGLQVARHSIETAGKAVRLVAGPDRHSWKADGYDLQHIVVRAVDAKGRTVPDVTECVEFSVGGEATIVAVDNGDMYSGELHSPETANRAKRSLYRGRALVILRSTSKAGVVMFTADSPSLKGAQIKLHTIEQ